MSAIAGAWSRRADLAAGPLCRTMAERLALYGPDGCDLAETAGFAAARCLRRILDEDVHDRQPLRSGEVLLVADVRIDNRSELDAMLGGGAAGESDSALLLRAWLRWREALLDRLIGDFAFAVWDSSTETLFLARDPLGERPLHYHAGDGFFAFASIPGALAAADAIGMAVDEEKLACFVADLPSGGGRSFLAGVNRLEPGHWLKASMSGVRTQRYWDPRKASVSLPPARELGEGLREQIDRAVAARLRRASGQVGAQLSAGLDSGAVAASAARQLAPRGESLLAFTAAPRSGFAGPVPAGRYADESRVAAATAALQPNIIHSVLRSDGQSPLSLLAAQHALTCQPVGHVANHGWWSAIHRKAAESGVKVLLTGEAGNLTISAGGGLQQLGMLARSGHMARLAREIRALRRQGIATAKLLNAAFGPFLPESGYGLIRRLVKGPEPRTSDVEFVAPKWKRAMAERERRAGWKVAPARDERDRRWAVLQGVDPGCFRKASLAAWGIEERDPTADRKLVEYCFALPVEALLEDGVRRPALREALSGQVAPGAFDSDLRGYQAADWYEQIGGRDVFDFAERLKAEAPDAPIDHDAIEQAARSWPDDGWERRELIYRYRTRLLRALAAGDFVRTMKAL